ncbi:MAG: M81 family metallopeptidase [Chloroflexi bacterium]|nr:M81 family metallopeptidase [Chloroflexota bacterium]
MPRILVTGCEQEISTFNPVLCLYDFFTILRGEELITGNRGKNSTAGGAIAEFESAGCEIVPTWHAQGDAAGPLEHASFVRMATEFLDALKPHAGKIDGAYFSLHGSMGTTEELDPEGYLLQEARKILGESVPIVISLDLHGVLTARMMRHANAVTSYHTYPHVDFADTGRRAAKLLLRIVNDGASPVGVRVRVPALVRGNELITETGLFGSQIRQAKALERAPGVLSAGFLICNPFTDVPELCSQAFVYTDGDADAAERGALEMTAAFWPNRARMQAALVGLEEAVSRAAGMRGPVAFTDAADATSSGASGNSNAIVSEMVRQSYPHTVLAPIADPPLVAMAYAAGVGSRINARVGGSLDPRYKPLDMELEVVSLSEASFDLETWVFRQFPGRTAVLRGGKVTLVATTKPVMHVDRALFFANGLDPKDFHSTVVKSPHCEPQFFNDWVEENINVDAPGATSANLRSLGHTVCARPMYPLDEDAKFNPVVERY